MTPDNLFGELIYAYTRKNAIDDGVLTDITPLAKKAGFKLNTCVAQYLFEECLREQMRSDRDIDDILSSILDAALREAFSNPHGLETDRLYVPFPWNKHNKFIAQVGPGDNAEPVLTLMVSMDD